MKSDKNKLEQSERPDGKTSPPHAFVSKSDFSKAFTRWADDTKESKGVTDKPFCEEMRKKGYRDDRAALVLKQPALEQVRHTIKRVTDG